jgi:hypothetical protein
MSYPSCEDAVFQECANLHFILLTRSNTKTSLTTARKGALKTEDLTQRRKGAKRRFLNKS